MDLTIRLAGPHDLPAIVKLLAQLSLETPREDPEATAVYEAALDGVMADPRQSLLVAVSDAVVTGTACVIVIPNISHMGKPYAVVEDVVVDASARGNGIGAALMQRATEIARGAGCYKLVLTSNKVRTDAHGFYRRLGFVASHEGFRIDFDW